MDSARLGAHARIGVVASAWYSAQERSAHPCAVGVGFIASRYTAAALDRRWLRPTVRVISAAAAIVAITRAAGLAVSA